jgi:hypothetical protein
LAELQVIMFCSSCGKPLGAVAHIYDNQLLCEDCFLKSTNKTQSTTPSSTVFVSKHDDQQRAAASQSIPYESNPQPGASGINTASQSSGQTTIPPTHALFFFPNEQILWKRTLSKGIIHREATFTEVVTNLRAFVVDDALKSIVRACPLRGSVVVVTNTRRNYSNARMGYGYSGRYASTGLGTSQTFGDIQFMMNGNLILSLHNIVDPYGLKKLVEGTVKSSAIAR